MRLALSDPEAPIDYWRAVARRGVMAVGFSVWRFAGETWLGARILAPQTGLVRRAAYAAIEIDKAIALETGPDEVVRLALAHALEAGPAPVQQAAYQALLVERLWRAIAACPAQRLAALAAPHED